jgi:hypothetical protein
MQELSRQKLIARLNNLPLNLAAAKLLPPGWSNPRVLHVLALAQWGAQEKALGTAGDEEQVRLLQEGNPQVAMQWVAENREGDEILAADALDNLQPEEAAGLVLENIQSRMDSQSSMQEEPQPALGN